MKNIDIARDSFDKRKNFSRVLKQQGRVELESDWNEQTAITARSLRLMMKDLIGPHGGPEDECGFRIIVKDHPGKIVLSEEEKALLNGCQPGDFLLSRGRYYVNGLLCENHSPTLYSEQPSRPSRLAGHEHGSRYLILLDVWEREVTALEDDSIREVALGGADTAARMQVTWVVRAIAVASAQRKNSARDDLEPAWETHVQALQSWNRGALKARAREPSIDNNADDTAAQAYRGTENQLYRIEIHHGGRCGGPNQKSPPTFKWTRDNGIVVLPVDRYVYSQESVAVTVSHWGRDDTWSISTGDWVELIDVDKQHAVPAALLLKVQNVDVPNRLLILEFPPTFKDKVPSEGTSIHAGGRSILRRWDHKSGDSKKGGNVLYNGAVVIDEQRWVALEDGIEVWFEAGHNYRSGDYWLVPARAATGDVIWPRDGSQPAAERPHGSEHHYAPLALVDFDSSGTKYVHPLAREFGYRPAAHVVAKDDSREVAVFVRMEAGV